MPTPLRRSLALLPIAVLSLASSALADEPIMPLSEVRPGMSCTAETVFSGETPTEFPVTIKDIYQHPEMGDRLLVEVGGAAATTGIAQGMSGSPVYCPGPGGPAIAGALSATIGWAGGTVGYATPIEAMLSELPEEAGVAAAGGKAHPIQMLAAGVPAGVVAGLKKRSPKLALFQNVVTTRARKSKQARAASASMNPGDSVGMALSSGDWSFGAIGTVSYRQGNRIWAFGHQYMDVGTSSLFMTRAPITAVVPVDPAETQGSSYKLGVIGEAVGVFDNDALSSVSGTAGGEPGYTTQVARVQGRSTQRVSSKVADESAEGWPHYGNLNQALAGTSLSTAAYKALGSSWVSKFSSRTCWKITVDEIEDPLTICRQVAANKPWDPFEGAGWLLPLTDPEYMAVRTIAGAAYANLRIKEVRSDAVVSNSTEVATLLKARQTDKTRKGVAQVELTYRNQASGKTETASIRLRVGSRSRGRTATIRGIAERFATDMVLTNEPKIPTDQDGYPQAPTGAESEEELRAQIQSLSGSTEVSIRGLKGGVRYARVNLNKLLPVGQASFRVR